MITAILITIIVFFYLENKIFLKGIINNFVNPPLSKNDFKVC